MKTQPKRVRRCQLAVPGSQADLIKKAAASSADHVFMDLEDAVAPNAKVAARQTVIDAFNELDWGKTVRCYRINDLRTAWCYKDIVEVVTGAGDNIDTIMIPKAMDGRDVFFVSTLLDQLEADLGIKKKIGIEVLIEETEGLQNVEEICAASPRMECVVFGLGDYAASQKIEPLSVSGVTDYPGDHWHYARFRITMAAATCGLDAVDGPYANLGNMAGYREECKRAMTLGMAGKWALTPKQIPTAIDVFSPDPSQVQMARFMEAEYKKAEAQGLGSIKVQEIMVDAATIRLARNVIDAADLMGL